MTKVKLTNDPLTNIKLMVPLLNDRARERFSDMMYGCYINGMYSEGDKAERKQESSNLSETSRINGSKNVSKDFPGQISLQFDSKVKHSESGK